MSTGSAVLAAGVFAVAVGAAAAGFVVVDSDTAAAGRAEREQREFISQRTLTCQPLRSGRDRQAWAMAVTVPGVPGVDGDGVLRVGALGRGRGAAAKTPGTTVRLPSGSAAVSPLISAEGAAAPGLAAAAVTADTAGEGKGLMSGPCQSAGSDLWFLGGGAGDIQRDSLVLTNPTTTDSVVDLTVYGRGGRLDVTGAEGLSVAAGSSRTVRLDVIAPGVSDSAIRVRTQVGLVAAAIIDDRMEGLTPRGTDVIGPSGRPASRVLLPVPGGPGSRRIVALAPGERTAVSITALTEEGRQNLFGEEKLPLKPGHVFAVDVAERLGGRAAVLQIESDSDSPVLAGLSAATDPDSAAAEAAAAAVSRAERALDRAKGAAARREARALLAKAETRNAIPPGEDLAWYSAAAPLSGTAAVTGLRSAGQVELLLAAPAGDSAATVSVLPADDTAARLRGVAEIAVPGGTTKTLSVPAPGGGDFFTVVVAPTPDGDPLVAGHVQRGAAGAITGYSLQPLPAWVALPQSHPRYAPN